MSWFLSLSPAVTKGGGTLPPIGRPDVTFQDITGTSFGRATAGNAPRRRAYVLLSGGCSTDILKSDPKGRSWSLVPYLREVLVIAPSCAVLMHFCRGNIASELVQLSGSEELSLENFGDLYPRVREDVRYVLVAPP